MMTNTQLATASLDDIVFDGRNRHYGAYELRALYQRHVTRALAIAIVMCALLLAFPLVARMLASKLPPAPPKKLDGNTLIAPPLTPDPVTPQPPEEAKPPVQPPKQTTVKDVVPIVVKTEEAPEESEVPNREELENKPTGIRNVEGETTTSSDNLEDLGPGKDEGVTRDVVAPTVYKYVEQMPELPGGGGQAAIVAAIQKLVKYPGQALRAGVEGRVYASFTVNTNGEVVDVKIVKGLGSGLDEETMRAIAALPKFIPGKQNGRDVNVSFTVPITFKIQ